MSLDRSTKPVQKPTCHTAAPKPTRVCIYSCMLRVVQRRHAEWPHKMFREVCVWGSSSWKLTHEGHVPFPPLHQGGHLSCEGVTTPAHLWSGFYAPKGQTSLLWDALVSSPNYAKETSLINIQIIEPCTWNVTARQTGLCGR